MTPEIPPAVPASPGPLTDDGHALLRDVLTWARANGWTPRDRRYRPRTIVLWEHDTTDLITVDYDRTGLNPWIRVDVCVYAVGQSFTADYGVTTIREAVDVLAALGVLPAELSSMHAAGVRVGMDMAEVLTDDVIEERAADLMHADLVRLDDDQTRRALGDYFDGYLLDPPLLPADPYERRVRLEAIVEGVSEILGVRNAD